MTETTDTTTIDPVRVALTETAETDARLEQLIRLAARWKMLPHEAMLTALELVATLEDLIEIEGRVLVEMPNGELYRLDLPGTAVPVPADEDPEPLTADEAAGASR